MIIILKTQNKINVQPVYIRTHFLFLFFYKLLILNGKFQMIKEKHFLSVLILNYYLFVLTDS